eukprot:1988095-Prymnesium_polylepis.1
MVILPHPTPRASDRTTCAWSPPRGRGPSSKLSGSGTPVAPGAIIAGPVRHTGRANIRHLGGPLPACDSRSCGRDGWRLELNADDDAVALVGLD